MLLRSCDIRGGARAFQLHACIVLLLQPTLGEVETAADLQHGSRCGEKAEVCLHRPRHRPKLSLCSTFSQLKVAIQLLELYRCAHTHKYKIASRSYVKPTLTAELAVTVYSCSHWLRNRPWSVPEEPKTLQVIAIVKTGVYRPRRASAVFGIFLNVRNSSPARVQRLVTMVSIGHSV